MNRTDVKAGCDPAAVARPDPSESSCYSAMEQRCAEARHKLHSVPGDPFLFADWERVLFLHFVIDPALVRPHVPTPFQLELYNGHACVSLVCVTMRKFRPCRFDPAAIPFRCIREQRFLNLRTYVRCDEESGALFLHGWLSKPAPLPFASRIFSLPYTFAELQFAHTPLNGMVHGSIKRNELELAYKASVPEVHARPPEPGSMAEFVMERYSGFFARSSAAAYVFRAWHAVWKQKVLDAQIERDDLIAEHFAPWREATFVGATLADTCPRVELGKAHRIALAPNPHHKTLSRMFELP